MVLLGAVDCDDSGLSAGLVAVSCTQTEIIKTNWFGAVTKGDGNQYN